MSRWPARGGAIAAGLGPRADLRRQRLGHRPARRARAERPGRPRRRRRSAASPSACSCPRSRRPRPGTTTAGRPPTSRARATSRPRPSFEPAQTVTSRIFLSGIMVDAAPDARAVVTVRRFDHRRRRLHARRQPPLARLPGRAPERGGRQGRGAERGHLRRAGAARPHGRQRAGPLRPRRAEPPARRHGGADDGHQRHRLAGARSWCPRASRRPRPRTSSPATSS